MSEATRKLRSSEASRGLMHGAGESSHGDARSSAGERECLKQRSVARAYARAGESSHGTRLRVKVTVHELKNKYACYNEYSQYIMGEINENMHFTP
jgi:hypothetical protein